MHVNIKEVRNFRFSENLAGFVLSLPPFHPFALLPAIDSNDHDKYHIFFAERHWLYFFFILEPDSLRERYPGPEFFLVRIFLHSD